MKIGDVRINIICTNNKFGLKTFKISHLVCYTPWPTLRTTPDFVRTRVFFIRNKRKSFCAQLARADVIHSQREIEEIFYQENPTLSISSEH